MAFEALPVLLGYLWRIFPIMGLFAVWLYSTPRAQTRMRVLILIFAFVCIRDMMTPAGLWVVGGEPPLRFHANPWALALLGVGSIVLIAMLARFLPLCWRLVVGFKGNRTTGMAVGIAAGCCIGLPIRLHLALEQAPLLWLLCFALFAFAGNALEEVLFRGMLQGQLERHTTAQRAALGSAFAFCACHSYLAFVLTQLGWPIVLFTLVEGLVCSQVRLKFGTWPATATHGTAILLIGAPLA
ncbi:CPBP family intramembrane metalloprotease [Pseudomonas entomophila]|uniref:CPBP family intramembrane glutamic endopeptidase n=1 Tax=Pseudomonas entomophila TaxID=312306 RepID=UPI0023D83D3F|nr:CPBP family intramembrane glutamic endopeptidase [Pseudomonas entomophila]MDF0730879.1 CPBP family intramembrane metalloprotease [Pseudomonas entomophila]